MQLRLMALLQLIQQHQDAKLIYQHAIGMVTLDAQVGDVQHISVYNQHVQLSQLLDPLVGRFQLLVLMLLA